MRNFPNILSIQINSANRLDIDIFDMEKPFVSVLIPAYNCASFIVQTLQSVLNQDYTNFEILICDDGSIDRTLEVIKALAKKDNRIKVYENVSNKGKVLTINYLLQEASILWKCRRLPAHGCRSCVRFASAGDNPQPQDQGF